MVYVLAVRAPESSDPLEDTTVLMGKAVMFLIVEFCRL